MALTWKSRGGGTNDYIWNVSNPASYNEVKAVIDAAGTLKVQFIGKKNVEESV